MIGAVLNTMLNQYTRPKEGLHDVARTYTHTILPHPLVSFVYHAV